MLPKLSCALCCLLSLASASAGAATSVVRIEDLLATDESAVSNEEFTESLDTFAARRGGGGGGNSPNWMTSGNTPNWYTKSNTPNWVTAGNTPNWLTAGSTPNWYTGRKSFAGEGANFPEPAVGFEE